jgi:chemotaxis signal transduction protein
MTEPVSELLMFQVGARVFLSTVRDVVRIGNVAGLPRETLVEGTSLGPTFARERGIVVAAPGSGAESTLVVDQVLGVRTVLQSEVQPLPAFAAAVLTSGAVSGLVLLDDAPTLIVDLPALIRERLAGPPTRPPPPAATATATATA